MPKANGPNSGRDEFLRSLLLLPMGECLYRVAFPVSSCWYSSSLTVRLELFFAEAEGYSKLLFRLDQIILLYLKESQPLPLHSMNPEVHDMANNNQAEATGSSFIQRILFGSPGTGKSYRVRKELLPSLDISPDSKNCVQTVFHPEYNYGDFIGKLMPLSEGGKVEYNYYEGHFLRALAQAYRNILNASEGKRPDNVALVIDEINRGNSAAIFGTVFQLLDRKASGWSEYSVNVSRMEFHRLMKLIGVRIERKDKIRGEYVPIYAYKDKDKYKGDKLNDFLEPLDISRGEIKVPPNLSLIATMNTSDHSIYHMDAAFKRRWEWQYMSVDGSLTRKKGNAFGNRESWLRFVGQLNRFIKDNHKYIRNVEDRLIGHRYINAENRPITYAEVQNKLMFFLWDSVFERSKEPLAQLLDEDTPSVATFGDFAERVEDFIVKIKNR